MRRLGIDILLMIYMYLLDLSFGQSTMDPASTMDPDSSDELDEDCPMDPDKANTTSLIIGVVIIYIICLSCAILLLIYLIKFYQNRDDPNVENRHPRLVYCTVLMVIFMDIVLFPLAIDYWTLECVTHTPWLRQPDLDIVPMESFLISAIICVLYAWLILVVLRVWLLRFDYGASLARKSQIWKNILDTGGGSSTWWIKNQQTWGTEAYLLKIISIPYILAVLLSIIVSPVLANATGISTWTPMSTTVGGISVILCCFIITNVWKVRAIHDNYHIKDEVYLFAKSSVILAAILVIIFGISRGVESEVSNYIVLIWGILVMGLLTTASYIQTGWVLYGIRRKHDKSEKLIASINDEWESNISLETVLESKEGFEIFMDFLVAEYSTENLLCYVEATQFLRKWKYVIYRMKILQDSFDNNTKSQEIITSATNYVQKQIAKNAESDDEIDGQPWAFHDKDSILIKFQWVKKPPVMTKEDITLWDHFQHLRSKYISATSAHQVNIRSALYKHFGKIKREDCELRKLDLTDVFNDPLLDQEEEDKSSSDGVKHQLDKPNGNGYGGGGGISDVSDDEDLDRSFQPGQTPDVEMVDTKLKGENTNTKTLKNGKDSSNGKGSAVVRRSQTSQYNRNLRKLQGVAKVLQLIEDTRKELWKNMNDSFVRFRSTESYVNYIKKIYLNRKKESSSNEPSRDNLYVGIDSD